MLSNQDNRMTGLSAQSLRTWGILALIAGIMGNGIIQNSILGIRELNVEQIMAAMQDSAYMGLATIALILNAIEACAIPIFAFLLVEGYAKSKNRKFYFLRVAFVTFVSEIPFNFLYTGKWISFDRQNPMFAILIAMLLLFFYRRFSGKQFVSVLIRIVLTAAAVIWMEMLNVYNGTCFVLVTVALWAFRNKKLLSIFGGCCVAALCTVISPFYLAAPVAFLAINFYNGERGSESRLINYAVYPAVLIIFALVVRFL